MVYCSTLYELDPDDAEEERVNVNTLNELNTKVGRRRVEALVVQKKCL